MTHEDDSLSPEVRFHLIRRMERLKVIGLSGYELLPHEAKYIEFHRVAGVILFERNIRSLSQVSELVAGVSRRIAPDGPPPLVMADHEGDFVSELRRIIGTPPAPLAIAATGDVDLAEDVAYETGNAMAKLGVNTVLAPVADCYLNAESPITGLRTFGRDPERVAEFVARTIAGFRRAGVLTCAKHFPGHGSTDEDSHETLPEVKKSLEELRETDLVPFRRAVDEGVDMMMASHVAFSAGSQRVIPASFDARVITSLLREEMGYDGVVMTDALEMAGAQWYTRGRLGGFAGGAEHALLAGADLLLHSRAVPEHLQVDAGSDPVLSVDVIETIVKTLERVVDPARIDEKLEDAARDNEALGNVLGLLARSLERVERLRERLGPPADAARGTGGKVVAIGAYPSEPPVYRTVAERSVASLTDWSEFAPLEPESRLVVVPVEWCVGASLHSQAVEEFADVLCRHFPRGRVTGLVRGFESTPGGGARPVIEGPHGGVVDVQRFDGSRPSETFEMDGNESLVVVWSARGAPGEEFLAALQAFGDEASPAVVLVTGWLERDWIPEESAALWTLGASAPVAAATAQILLGHAQPEGSTGGLVPE